MLFLSPLLKDTIFRVPDIQVRVCSLALFRLFRHGINAIESMDTMRGKRWDTNKRHFQRLSPPPYKLTMMKLTIVALLAGAAFSFSPISQTTRQSTQLRESFGLGIGEDTYENQPALLRGEQEYKQFVNKYAENNMLNRKVRLFLEFHAERSELS